MLPHDEGVDVAAVHPQLLPQQLLQPAGVQHGARADDPLPGVAGQPPGRLGQYVHRVGHDEQDALEGAGGDLPQDTFQDRGVFVDKVQPGLPRLLVGAGGDDHQGAVG